MPKTEQLLSVLLTENESSDDENNQPDDRVRCAHCGVKYKRDQKEKHFKSKLHASNTKSSPLVLRARAIDTEEYQCETCGTVFTDELFYKSHMGSKTHKRNASRLNSKKIVADDSYQCISEFSRKKYKTRLQDNVKNNQEREYYLELQSYLNELIAYVSLRLAFDTEVVDFSISADDKKWHSFGDVVVKITKREKGIEEKNNDSKYKTTHHAIKCKRISNFNRQMDSLSDVKLNLEKEYESLMALRKVDDFKSTIFSVFTTCVATSQFSETVTVGEEVLNKWRNSERITADVEFLVKPVTKRGDVLNVTNEPDNILTVYPKEKPEELKDSVDYNLPKILIYTSQKIHPKMFRDVLKNTFRRREQFGPEIQEYTKYIEQWANGQLGGHHYLNRNDVVLKMGEIFLHPFVVTPTTSLKTMHSINNDFGAWNEIVEKVDLILLKNEPASISKICEPLNQLIEKTTTKLDETSCIELTDEVIKKISNDPMSKAYFFEEVEFSEQQVSIRKLYRIFWKSCKIPLLLHTKVDENNDFLLDVMSTMKSFGAAKKFVLFAADPFSVKTSLKNLITFSNLEDIKDLVDLSRMGLKSTTSDYYLSLEDVSRTDQFFLKWVTPDIFFDIALGNYYFRADFSNREKSISDLKMVLDDSTISEVRNDLSQCEAATEENPTDILGGRLKGINPELFSMETDNLF